jgi:mannose-6-phosphate isomerase-like protein (cupin superfamily)
MEGVSAVTPVEQVIVRHWEDDHLRLPLVEGEGDARALLWPGVGSTQRALHHISLAGGQQTVVLMHPDSEAVYYIAKGQGRVEDLDDSRAEDISEGKMVLVTPASRYRFVADSHLIVVGGPCPVDPRMYVTAEVG